MVNNIIVNYLRDNIDDYELDSLVEKLIKSGYSQEEINLAIHYLKLNKKSSKKYKIQKKNDQDWMKMGAFASFILLVYVLISIISSFFILNVGGFLLTIHNLIYAVLSLIAIFSLFFLYLGIYHLGKHLSSKTLKFSSLSALYSLIAIFSIIFISGIAIFAQSRSITGNSILGNTINLFSKTPIPNFLSSPIGILLEILLLLGLIYYFISEISLGLELVRLRKKIKYAKFAGIFKLLTSFALILLFILIFYLVSVWIIDPTILVQVNSFFEINFWILSLFESLIFLLMFFKLFFVGCMLYDGSWKRKYKRNLNKLQNLASQIRMETKDPNGLKKVKHEPKSIKILLPKFPDEIKEVKKKKKPRRKKKKSNKTKKTIKKKSRKKTLKK